MTAEQDIEIEQAIRWLCEHANHFTICTYNGGVKVFAAWMGATKNGSALRLGDGPTLREALLDAIAYMKAGQHTPPPDPRRDRRGYAAGQRAGRTEVKNEQ